MAPIASPPAAPTLELDPPGFGSSGIPDRIAELAALRLGSPAVVVRLNREGEAYTVGTYRSSDSHHPGRGRDTVRRAILDAPICDGHGVVVGDLRVFDHVARRWTEGEAKALDELAEVAGRALEHFRMSERVGRAEEQYRQVFHSSPHASYVLDREGRIVEVNDAVCRMLRCTPAELRGRHFLEMVAPVDHSVATAEFQELVSGDTASTDLELGLVRSDGDVRECTVTATALRGDGTVTGVHGVASDVTEVRAAERARRCSEQRFRALFEHNPLAVVLLDRELRLVDGNPAFERLSGHAVAALAGGTLRRFVPRSRLRDVVAHFDRILEGETRQVEERLHDADRAPVDVRMTLLPVLVDGRVTGAFAIVEDIGERVELEAKLRHSAKMEAVGRLAGGVAHDFNNLLTVISGHAELVLGEVGEGGLRDDLEEIRRTADRGAGLTRQLLLFSRTKMTTPSLVDPNRSVSELRRMLQRVLGEDKRLVTRLGDGVWSVKVDPTHLDQVLMNLVINARDAIAGCGEIRITTSNRCIRAGAEGAHGDVLPGNYVEIAVEDTGEGMTPGVLERIYEPFYTTKEPGRGTGLGLATVQGIVQSAEGYVRAESRPGEGSRFTILLPRSVDRDSGGPPDAHPDGPGRTSPALSVLVVEDEDAVRSMTRRVLERRGHTVRTAADPAEALELAGDPGVDFDLLLTDLVMPGTNGAELAERIVALRPGTPVVYMSGYVEEAVRRRVGSVGRGPLLEKPFRAQTLLRVVEAVARDVAT